jgi:hypothetical protein
MNQNQRLPETLVDHLAFNTVWRKSVVRASPDGKGWLPEAETEFVKNTIVNCGMDFLAQQISSWAAPAKMSHMIVGTSTAVPTLSDYRLPGEVTGGRKTFAATSVSNNTWSAVCTWGGGADGVTSCQLQNAGIGNSANSGTQIFNHVQFSQTVLANSDFLRLELYSQIGSSGH